MSTRVRSFCKINLGLAIGPARLDGFHALTTLYQTLALHDIVTVTVTHAPETSITLTANHPGVPRTQRGDAEKNTAFRIVDLALRRLGVTAEIAIDIQKCLPVQGGLGAGSANAAAALIGVERELDDAEGGVAVGVGGLGAGDAGVVGGEGDAGFGGGARGDGDEVVEREGLVAGGEGVEAVRTRGADGEAEVDLGEGANARGHAGSIV